MERKNRSTVAACCPVWVVFSLVGQAGRAFQRKIKIKEEQEEEEEKEEEEEEEC